MFWKAIHSLYFYKLYKFIKILLKLFSTPTWISSTYKTSLKFSEKQLQNFHKFFVKFTQISFIIDQKISKFPRNFSEYFFNSFSKFQQILLKTNTFF